MDARRQLSAGSDQAGEVDDLIADLRETHRRRPRLQQEFDRVGPAVTQNAGESGSSLITSAPGGSAA